MYKSPREPFVVYEHAVWMLRKPDADGHQHWWVYYGDQLVRKFSCQKAATAYRDWHIQGLYARRRNAAKA